MEPEDADVVLAERYDRSSGLPMSVFVVRLVAIAADERPIDLEPLGRSVDVESLERLIGATSPADDTRVSVRFAYEGYTVDIDADGTVRLLAEPD